MASSCGATGSSDVEILAHIRKHKIRCPDIVLNLGKELLSRNSDEVWAIYEQVCEAALDLQDFEQAQSCFEALEKRFPNSTRVNVLRGMMLEAMQQWFDAEQIYQKIIEENPSNAIARKRLITIHKSNGDIQKALEELRLYLETFQTDSNAWQEMGYLYTTLGAYRQASFCFEETILLSPFEPSCYVRYAETQFAVGSESCLLCARKYFAHALTLESRVNDSRVTPNSPIARALYGITRSAIKLASMNRRSTSKSDEELNRELYLWARERLLELYSAHSSLIDIVRHSLPGEF